MFEVKAATKTDIPIWFEFDQHISQKELENSTNLKRCFLLKKDHAVIGVMRYNLFWDEIPFLTMINIMDCEQGKGFGTKAIEFWENEVRQLGFNCVMTSSQSDERGQRFYRKLGFKDAGCLILDIPLIAQPAELFFIKAL